MIDVIGPLLFVIVITAFFALCFYPCEQTPWCDTHYNQFNNIIAIVLFSGFIALFGGLVGINSYELSYEQMVIRYPEHQNLEDYIKQKIEKCEENHSECKVKIKPVKVNYSG